MPTHVDTWYCFIVQEGTDTHHFGATPSMRARGGARALRPPTSWKGYATPVSLLYAESCRDEEAAYARSSEICDYTPEQVQALCASETNTISKGPIRVL